jgi:hypothetical protein
MLKMCLLEMTTRVMHGSNHSEYIGDLIVSGGRDTINTIYEAGNRPQMFMQTVGLSHYFGTVMRGPPYGYVSVNMDNFPVSACSLEDPIDACETNVFSEFGTQGFGQQNVNINAFAWGLMFSNVQVPIGRGLSCEETEKQGFQCINYMTHDYESKRMHPHTHSSRNLGKVESKSQSAYTHKKLSKKRTTLEP